MENKEIIDVNLIILIFNEIIDRYDFFKLDKKTPYLCYYKFGYDVFISYCIIEISNLYEKYTFKLKDKRPTTKKIQNDYSTKDFIYMIENLNNFLNSSELYVDGYYECYIKNITYQIKTYNKTIKINILHNDIDTIMFRFN